MKKLCLGILLLCYFIACDGSPIESPTGRDIGKSSKSGGYKAGRGR